MGQTLSRLSAKERGETEGKEDDCAEDEEETEHEGMEGKKMMISVKILLSYDSRGSALHRCLPATANLRMTTSLAGSIFYSQLIM